MAIAVDIAVVVRARRGRNLLLQTRGLDPKVVLQATQEAAVILESDANLAEVDPVDAGLTQQGPALCCSRLDLLGGRWNLVYRLVNQVFVMVFAPAGCNVFTCLQLANTVTRLLVVECKTVEVTADKVEKRYAQVYVSVAALLARGSLDVYQALLDTTKVFEELTPDVSRGKKGKGREEKGIGANVTSIRPNKRRLNGAAVHMAKLKFPPPAELAPQLPPPVLEAPAKEVPAAEDEDPFAEFAVQREASSKQPGDAAGDLLSGAPGDAKDQGWAAFDEEPQAASLNLSLDKLLLPGGTIPPPAAPGPPPGALDKVAVPVPPPMSGPLLRLIELWRGEVEGRQLKRAGLVGHVRWRAAEVRSLSGAAPFQLVAPARADPLMLKAMQCVQRNEKGTKPGVEHGTFLADALSSLPVATPILRYLLPATSLKAPLMAQISTRTMTDMNDVTTVLVAITVAIQGGLETPFEGLVTELSVPSSFGTPLKASPPCEWSKTQGTLRWLSPRAVRGQQLTYTASFKVVAGSEVAQLGVGLMQGTATLRGTRGATLSGLSLSQSPGIMRDLKTYPDACEWSASIVMRARKEDGS